MFRITFIFRAWLVMIFVILFLVPACKPSGSVIRIEPPDDRIRTNNSVKVPVNIRNVNNLTAIEIHLSFDTAVLEVLELLDGDFIKADFVVQNRFDNLAGTIDFAIAQIDRSPANGSGTLLVIVFRAKASGESPIRFRSTPATPAGVLLSDPYGMEIPVTFVEGNVKIESP